MLRLTLELFPYGSERDKRLIKKIDIVNDGWHNNPVKYGNYKVRAGDNPHTEMEWRRRYITDFPREKYDALYLAYLVLRKMVHEDEHIDPIDPKAAQDREASAGPGHHYVSDGDGRVGGQGYSKRGPYGRDKNK